MIPVRIIQGDCLAVLRGMPEESVHCVVTSPPYWGVRSFGEDSPLGLEETLEAHLEAIVGIFEEVRRVLRADGTVWLNYGDTYAAAKNGRSAADTKAAGRDDRTFRDKPFSTVGGVFKAKDLCLLPSRVAIALQAAGWYVRSEIIWHKPNPMPESIKDRPGVAHEKVFLLTKSARYFYDGDAVREPAEYGRRADPGRIWARAGDAKRGPQRLAGATRGADPSTGRALRNVWTIATAPYREAHFATFPPAIPERCIKAGCPKGGIVLDPFAGAGTVGLVAHRLGRRSILVDLNPEYVRLSARRIQRDAQRRGYFGEIVSTERHRAEGETHAVMD